MQRSSMSIEGRFVIGPLPFRNVGIWAIWPWTHWSDWPYFLLETPSHSLCRSSCAFESRFRDTAWASLDKQKGGPSEPPFWRSLTKSSCDTCWASSPTHGWTLRGRLDDNRGGGNMEDTPTDATNGHALGMNPLVRTHDEALRRHTLMQGFRAD